MTNAPLRWAQSDVADLARLPGLLAAVDQLCARAGASETDAYAFKLAVEEACVNAMTHAYQALTPGPLDVSLLAQRQDDGTAVLQATLRYGGHAFDPRDQAEPDVDAPLEDRQVGGLGVMLMRRLTEVSYQRLTDGSNCLILLRRCVG